MKDRKTTRRTKIITTIIVLLFLHSILVPEAPYLLVLFAIATGWALFLFNNAHYVVTHYPIAIVLLVAVVAGYLILDIALSRFWHINNERQWQQRWTRGIVIAAVVLPVAGVAASGTVLQIKKILTEDPPSVVDKRGRAWAQRVICASHMRQLEQAAMLYANEHGGVMPDSMEAIFQAGGLENKVLACGSSSVDPPNRHVTADERDAWIRAGNSSYIYHGRGMRWPAPDNYPLFTEVSSNHIEGMNICFGDGHTEFVPLSDLPIILARLDRNAATQPAEQ